MQVTNILRWVFDQSLPSFFLLRRIQNPLMMLLDLPVFWIIKLKVANDSIVGGLAGSLDNKAEGGGGELASVADAEGKNN